MLTHLSLFFRQRSTYFMVELMLVSEMPHGGQKLSGYGKGMSMYGLEDYTAIRYLMFTH